MEREGGLQGNPPGLGAVENLFIYLFEQCWAKNPTKQKPMHARLCSQPLRSL